MPRASQKYMTPGQALAEVPMDYSTLRLKALSEELETLWPAGEGKWRRFLIKRSSWERYLERNTKGKGK